MTAPVFIPNRDRARLFLPVKTAVFGAMCNTKRIFRAGDFVCPNLSLTCERLATWFDSRTA